MQKQTQFTVIALLIFTIALSGCKSFEFTIVSTREIQLDLNTYGHPVTGTAQTIDAAINKALKKAGNTYDALINCVIYPRMFDYKVVGVPIKTSEARKWD